VPYAQLPEMYHLADAFVLLTHPDQEHNEAWGSVFLEAAAARVPVVAGSAGGVEEAVVDKQTGLVVDTYNEDQVVEAITTLLTNKEMVATLTTTARARAERQFRWNIQLKNML
jgi:glycosyltransferase involved in cell wall biosynthesis